MGEIKKTFPKKLICGLIVSESVSENDVLSALERVFGKIDGKSQTTDFSKYSNYYEKEMGNSLNRFFVSFERLIMPDEISEIKIKSNDLEFKLSDFETNQKRKVNIDPGYIGLSKMVVASTKNASYRIYLKNGIYAQPMLWFFKNSFLPYDWTYPDYKDKAFIGFFNKVREKYKRQLKENGKNF